MMKLSVKLTICPALVMLAGAAVAGPLDRTEVAADAKWVVHVDFEALRETTFGSGLWDFIDEGRLSAIQDGISQKTGVNFDFDDLDSLTAYGNDFPEEANDDAVLLVHADHDWKATLDEIAARSENSAGENKRLSKDADAAGREVYSVHSADGQLFGAVPKEGLLTLVRSKEAVAEAVGVIGGTADNLGQGTSFAGYADINAPIFFMVTAEGLEDVEFRPEAKIFQKAEGGRLILGESRDRLFLNLALKSSDEAVRGQIAAVINGIVAIAQLSQQEDPDLVRVLETVEVSQTSAAVAVQFAIPSERALARAREILGNQNK